MNALSPAKNQPLIITIGPAKRQSARGNWT
jgi:hypothetical protein